MAHSYTPGLKVAKLTVVDKERRLPIKGEVLAKKGDKVKADDIVARTELPGDVERLNLAGRLGMEPKEVIESGVLKKQAGDKIEKGEIIAETKGFFGLFKTVVTSPITGVIESYSEITGQMTLRKPPKLVEVDAYINGEVVDIIEGEGVIVRSAATFIQGIFGIGGEVKGEIVVPVSSPADKLTVNDIKDEYKGKVVVGGSYVTADVLRKARDIGVKAIVVGGIDDKDLRDFMGYDIGVAITGNENLGLTLVVTEGFGEMTMAKKTFNLLKENEGQRASVNGATQIRAGVMRPEVIITKDDVDPSKLKEEETETKGMEVGDYVRIIRAPYFGAIGKVVALPPELHEIETEAKVRVLEFEFEDGRREIIPRANVEIIEE